MLRAPLVREPSPTHPGRGPRLLLVADSAVQRGIYAPLLTADGFVVVEASTGPAAITMLSGVRPALIVVDLSLPPAASSATVREIVRTPMAANLSVVVLSSYSYADCPPPSDGAALCLVKPFRLTTLVDAVRRLTGFPGTLGVLGRPRAPAKPLVPRTGCPRRGSGRRFSMSRSDAWAGLSTRGLAVVHDVRGREYDAHDGMCNRLPLLRYTLPDGREFFEHVQQSVWASGPTWFVTLQTTAADGPGVPEADWTDQEIAAHMGFAHGNCEPSLTAYDHELFTDLEPSVLAGRTHLYWADERKFHRWLAAARGAVMPSAVASMSPEAAATLRLLRWRSRQCSEVVELTGVSEPLLIERALAPLEALGWLQAPRPVGPARIVVLELTHDGYAAATLLPRDDDS
jgi:CheY-like chemotaxis protein